MQKVITVVHVKTGIPKKNYLNKKSHNIVWWIQQYYVRKCNNLLAFLFVDFYRISAIGI